MTGLLCAGDDVLRSVADCLGGWHSGTLAATCRHAQRVIRRHHHHLRLPDAGYRVPGVGDVHAALRDVCTWPMGPGWMRVALSPSTYHGVFRSVFAGYVTDLASLRELHLCFGPGPRRRPQQAPQPIRLPAGLQVLTIHDAPPTFDVDLTDARHLRVVRLHGRLLDPPHRGPRSHPHWLQDLQVMDSVRCLDITQTESGPRRRHGRVNTLLPVSPLVHINPCAPLEHVRLTLLDDLIHGISGLYAVRHRLRRLELCLNDQVQAVQMNAWVALAITLQCCDVLQALELSLIPGVSRLDELALVVQCHPPPRLRQLVITSFPWTAPDDNWQCDDEEVSSVAGLHTLVVPLTVRLRVPPTVQRLAWGDKNHPCPPSDWASSWVWRGSAPGRPARIGC